MSSEREPSTTVRIINPIPVDLLSRLLKDYSERLMGKVEAALPVLSGRSVWRTRAKSPNHLLTDAELMRDIEFLQSNITQLVEKASAYHEHIRMDEGERFELELRLFDAENALRLSKRALQRR